MTKSKYAKRQYRVTFTIEQDVVVTEDDLPSDPNTFDWEREAELIAETALRNSLENDGGDLEGAVTGVKWLRKATALAEKKRLHRG